MGSGWDGATDSGLAEAKGLDLGGATDSGLGAESEWVSAWVQALAEVLEQL